MLQMRSTSAWCIFEQKVAVPGQEPLPTHGATSHSGVHAVAHIGVNPHELGVQGRVIVRIHGRDDLKKTVLLGSSKLKGALAMGHDEVSRESAWLLS
jgi:hypothetical protein